MKHFLLLNLLFFTTLSSHAQCETFHTSISTIAPTCFGDEDGKLSAYPLGGDSPYSMDVYNDTGYLLNPFGGATVSDLGEGWYFVSAEDNSGCTVYDSVFIANPIPLTLNYSTTDPTANDICDGSILIDTVYGDYENLIYYWAPNPSGSIDSLLDAACYGTYTLVVTNEKGCFVDYTIDLALYLSINQVEFNDKFGLITLPEGRLLVQNKSQSSGEIICFNVAGQVVLTGQLQRGTTYFDFPQDVHLFIFQIFQQGELISSGKIVN